MYSIFISVYTCLFVFGYTCVGVCICEGSRLMPGIILDHFFTLYTEAGVLSKTQISPMWQALLASLLWAFHVSPFSCWNYRGHHAHPVFYTGLRIWTSIFKLKGQMLCCLSHLLIPEQNSLQWIVGPWVLLSKCPTMESWDCLLFSCYCFTNTQISKTIKNIHRLLHTF